MNPRTVNGLAALEKGGTVQPWSYELRALRPHDVQLDVQQCGLCHTDLHMIGSWGTDFPMVPGHEAVGVVREIGDQVDSVKPGDRVAVGTIVDSCRTCAPCLAGQETYCLQGATPTYGAPDRVDGLPTRGGYGESLVCDERFVYALPAGLDPAGAAPLLCAGITTWSPLRHWQVGPGSLVGVVGIGGLGHLAVKFARALGAEVVAFTSTEAKRDDALALGAHDVVLTSDPEQVAGQANRLDLVLDTVSAAWDMTPVVQALHLDGTYVSLGLPDHFQISPMALAVGRRRLAGSGSGGTIETREMLAFAAEHGIVADVEVIGVNEVARALERLAENDVRFRFVLDRTRS